MVEILYLGHSGFKISFPSANVLVDPFLKSPEDGKRMEASPFKGKDLRGIALILVTHEHFDHFEKETIEEIASRDNAMVVSHESVLQKLSLPSNRLKPVNAGDKLGLMKVNIEAVAVHHPHSFYPLGFLLDEGKEKIFHAGDASLTDNFSKIRANVALLPIGGKFTMDCVDGVRATKSLKPDYVVPMHYNTFEQIKCNPEEFRERIDKSILKTLPVILKPGQSHNFKF